MAFDIPFFYRCKTCASRGTTQSNQPACAKFKISINPEEDFCAWHTNESTTSCAFCGQTGSLTIYELNDEILPLCANCSSMIGTCHTCENIATCDFQNDHNEPQVVMKTVRQGMMTMQTQIKNPVLVDRHCKHCQCGLTTGDCLRDNNGIGCKNWKVKNNLHS